jgi:hypothetical protein
LLRNYSAGFSKMPTASTSVKFLEHHLYDLGLLCRHQFAYEIRLDRQFPVFAAAVDQYSELAPFFGRPKSINWSIAARIVRPV